MEFPLGIVLSGIDAFLLILVRVTGLFVVSPVFGRRNLPAYFKIGFSFMLALIFVNVVKVPEISDSGSIYRYAFLIAKEFIVGLTIGYVSYMMFTAIYIAGQLIDMQIGFGMVNILDPVSNIQVPVTSNFYFVITMIVFLAVNGHHMLIKALYDSFTLIPPGAAVFGENLIKDVIRLFGELFSIGFRIAAPVTAAVLITDVALGVISKSIPQLNVFVVGMPLKIALGIVVIMITIPMFILLLGALFDSMSGEMTNFMKGMGNG